MKKRGFLLTAAAMLLTLAMATIAQADTKTYYAAKEKVNAYEEKTSSSAKLKEYNGGDKILVEKSEDGWYGVLAPDPDGEGDRGPSGSIATAGKSAANRNERDRGPAAPIAAPEKKRSEP